MTAEFLSEALSFIDDELIEETDALRSKKKNYKSMWIKTLSAAACLCIALVAVIGAVNSDVFKGNGTLPTDSGEFLYGGGNFCTGVGGELLRYYVEITSWDDKGFYGVIKNSESDSGELQFGDEVRVRFSDDVEVMKRGEGRARYIPDEEDFPTGERVEVGGIVIDKTIGCSAGYELRAYYVGDITSSDTVVVRITEWNDSGFIGTKVGEYGKEVFYYVPETAVVEFTDNTRTEKAIDRGRTTLITLAPTEEDFPVGTIVEVSYEDSRIAKPTETVYYAERVWLFESADEVE